MLKDLRSLNNFNSRVTETILQGFILALCLSLTMQRYEKRLELPNIFS